MIKIYVLLTDSDISKPEHSDGYFLSAFSTASSALTAFKEKFQDEIMCFADECEMIEGEDYIYDEKRMRCCLVEDRQWWWIREVVL